MHFKLIIAFLDDTKTEMEYMKFLSFQDQVDHGTGDSRDARHVSRDPERFDRIVVGSRRPGTTGPEEAISGPPVQVTGRRPARDVGRVPAPGRR